MGRPLIYWIKFDRGPKPERIQVQHFQELQDRINYLVQLYGEPFEWMVRDYR